MSASPGPDPGTGAAPERLRGLPPGQGAAAVGQEFRLGRPESVRADWSSPPLLSAGWVLAVAAVVLYVVIGAFTSVPAVLLGVLGAAAVTGVVLIAAGYRRREVLG